MYTHTHTHTHTLTPTYLHISSLDSTKTFSYDQLSTQVEAIAQFYWTIEYAHTPCTACQSEATCWVVIAFSPYP